MASVTTSATRLPLAGRAVFAVPAGVALAALGLLVRVLLADVEPESGMFLVLLPAVAVAAALWGTLSGTVAALTEAGAAPVLYPGRPVSLLFGDVLFVLGAAVMLAAIRVLRREGARAAAAEARLGEVFRQVPAAAAIIAAPSGELLTRSEQLVRILGRPTPVFGDLDTLGAHGGVHRDGRPYAPQDYPIARALLRGEVTDGEGLRYRRPDGRVVELEVHAGPVRDAEGRIVAAVGMAFDVSDRVAAELRLRAALEAGALGTWEIDGASRRIRCDATMAAMFGLPAAAMELTREDIRRFFDPEDRAAAVFDRVAVQGEPGSAEIAIRTVQGERRWLVVRGAKLPDTGQMFGVARDITDRRMREEAASRELDERGLLLREADHRIKNSLQLVVAMLRLQADRVADPQARAALEAAVLRVDSVADAHLALQQSPDMRVIAADRMIADLCARLAVLDPAVTIRTERLAPVELHAEQAIPLGLVLSEILTNALRHAFPPGTGGVIGVRATAGASVLEIVVEDGGRGLPANPVPQTGLGSTIVRALAAQLDAEVTTTSAPGAGTTVTLRLPLAQCRPAARASAAA